jgi:hypothetical protein
VTPGEQSTATLIFLAIALEVIMVAASFQAKAQERGCSLLPRKQSSAGEQEKFMKRSSRPPPARLIDCACSG